MNGTPAPAPSPRSQSLIFLIALLGVLVLQLPWISRPPFDAHAFRQAQTLATIELFARDGIDLAHAKTNYVGEPGVFVLEFPLFQSVCALLYGWFGQHVWLVRLTNLLFTLGNAGLAFAIGKRLFNHEAGTSAAVIYLFAPLNLLYATSTLLDPSATFFSLATFLSALRILRPHSGERVSTVHWAALIVACTVTALIKTLYLFPTCVLLAGTFVATRKLSLRLFASGCCIVLAVGLFFLWLRHGREVNDASYFTRGVSATTLLGFQPLASPHFYVAVAKRLLIHLAGPAGALFGIAALIFSLSNRPDAVARPAFALSVLLTSVVLYYPAFARAHVHDYYSLVISPYAAIIAGFGVSEMARRAAAARAGWLAGFLNARWIVAAVAAASVIVFVKPVLAGKPPRLAPDPQLIELQRLAQGHFEPWSFAMVFVAPNLDEPVPANIGTEMPEVLYAMGLRGTGRLVLNGASALPIWNEYRPHYRNLKYVVFYRLDPPPEILRECRQIIAHDPGAKWFACRLQ